MSDVISLIGMSNVGKSYWSNRLATEAGFIHICCDDLIEAELGDVLKKLGYSGGIADVAKWLGQPYDPQFAQNQQTYLDLEISTMKSIISQLEQDPPTQNTVIDTTGSVVHTSPEIRRQLGALSKVVYLEATADMQQEMFELYIAEPKPVVWGEMYQPEPGESPRQALARCYPQLLAYRSKLYVEMSELTIPRATALSIAGVDEFLKNCALSVTMAE